MIKKKDNVIKRAMILSIALGLVPSYFLYKVIYGFYQTQAVWGSKGSSYLYSGEALKFHAYEDLAIYLGFVLFLSYFINSGDLLSGGKTSAKNRVANFFPQVLNHPSTLIIIILGSIIYLPIAFFLGSALNPW